MQTHEYAAICSYSEEKKGIKVGSIQLFILSEIATFNDVLLLCYACEGSSALHIHRSPEVGSFRVVIMCQSVLYRSGMWQ